MRRTTSWALAALAVFAGIAAAAAATWLLAPHLPRLWLLFAIPFLVAAAVAALAIRPAARRLGWRPGRAGAAAAALAILPFAALAAWIGTSTLPLLGPPASDPRGAPTMLALPTGSRLATWTLPGEGAQRRTPVVFLHGGPGHYAKPRDMGLGAPFRAAGFTTVFYDQAGSGASTNLPVAHYTVARQVADLEALRVALNADRLILWGESWGAILAARYALAHPSRVAAAILSSPGEYPGQGPLEFDYSGVMPSGADDHPPRMMLLYALLTRAPQLAEQWIDQPTHHRAMNAGQPAQLASPGPRCKGDRWDGKPRARVASSSLYTLRRLMLDEWSLPPPPPTRFPVPALIVRGSCDVIPPAAAQAYAAAFPRARFVAMPNAGHALFGHEAAFERAAAAFAQEDLAEVP